MRQPLPESTQIGNFESKFGEGVGQGGGKKAKKKNWWGIFFLFIKIWIVIRL